MKLTTIMPLAVALTLAMSSASARPFDFIAVKARQLGLPSAEDVPILGDVIRKVEDAASGVKDALPDLGDLLPKKEDPPPTIPAVSPQPQQVPAPSPANTPAPYHPPEPPKHEPAPAPYRAPEPPKPEPPKHEPAPAPYKAPEPPKPEPPKHEPAPAPYKAPEPPKHEPAPAPYKAPEPPKHEPAPAPYKAPEPPKHEPPKPEPPKHEPAPAPYKAPEPPKHEPPKPEPPKHEPAPMPMTKCEPVKDEYYSTDKECPARHSGQMPLPRGYELNYGPVCGATKALAYMSSHAMRTYDHMACAKMCDDAPPHYSGGDCKYFNMWEGEVEKGSKDAMYTCSLYYEPLGRDDATNYGDPAMLMKVVNSRGYKKL